jgi:hypothetical protein
VRTVYAVAMLLAVAGPVTATTLDDARAFFARYVELSAAFDPAVADLYADTAVIQSSRRYPSGVERDQEMTGAQWRTLVRTSMPAARQAGDVSEFTNIELREEGDRVRITASRTSVAKCYTDTTYAMLIAPAATGGFLIVAESLETQPQSDCGRPSPALGNILQAMAQSFAGKLPLTIDEETRFDAISVVDGSKLRYDLTLVNFRRDELDVAAFEAMARESDGARTCAHPQTREALAMGAVVIYTYRDRDGGEVCTFEIRDEDCR